MSIMVIFLGDTIFPEKNGFTVLTFRMLSYSFYFLPEMTRSSFAVLCSFFFYFSLFFFFGEIISEPCTFYYFLWIRLLHKRPTICLRLFLFTRCMLVWNLLTYINDFQYHFLTISDTALIAIPPCICCFVNACSSGTLLFSVRVSAKMFSSQ